MTGYLPANPRKLTDAVAARLVEAFGLGATNRDACRYAGISVDTLALWLAAGEEELSEIARAGEDALEWAQAGAVSRLGALALSIEGALGERAIAALGAIKDGAARDWRAALAYLERRHPDEWGKRECVDHTRVIVTHAEQLAKARGLDAEATARVVNFAVERAKRGVA